MHCSELKILAVQFNYDSQGKRLVQALEAVQATRAGGSDLELI